MTSNGLPEIMFSNELMVSYFDICRLGGSPLNGMKFLLSSDLPLLDVVCSNTMYDT
jgi:hypothetical protein